MAKKKTTEKPKKISVLRFRIKANEAHKIKAYANANKISASELIRDAVEAYLK